MRYDETYEDEDDDASTNYEDTYLEVESNDGSCLLVPLVWLKEVLALHGHKNLMFLSDKLH